jgi:hypothetical protein
MSQVFPSRVRRWRGRIAVLAAVGVAASAVTVHAIFAAPAPPAPDLLSQGKMHGDFFNAWPEAEMARRVRDCINPVIKCGPDGHP